MDYKKEYFSDCSKKIRSIFKKKMCLYFDHTTCDSEIIRSHTIQKRRSLDRIAIDGHVYGFGQTKKVDLASNPLSLQKISINEASTFNGFCKKHDNELFHEIDDSDFIPSCKQAYLITYRTLIRELYTKNASTKTEPVINDSLSRIPNFPGRNDFLGNVKAHQIGTQLGLSYLYSVADKMFSNLIKNDYNSIQYFVIELNMFPEVMVSGAFMPEYDYTKNRIQDMIGNQETSWFALNIFSDSTKGIISFTWLDDQIIEQFILSLIKSDDMINKIIELAFTNIENTFFSKEWWDKLTILKKSRIEKMVHNFIHYDMTTGEYTGIRNNNLHYVDWEVGKSISNNSKIIQVIDT